MSERQTPALPEEVEALHDRADHFEGMAATRGFWAVSLATLGVAGALALGVNTLRDSDDPFLRYGGLAAAALVPAWMCSRGAKRMRAVADRYHDQAATALAQHRETSGYLEATESLLTAELPDRVGGIVRGILVEEGLVRETLGVEGVQGKDGPPEPSTP